jgi:hypothetical protein
MCTGSGLDRFLDLKCREASRHLSIPTGSHPIVDEF